MQPVTDPAPDITSPRRARFDGPLRPDAARRLTDALCHDEAVATPVVVDLRHAPADDGLALGVLLNVHLRLCGERRRSDAGGGRPTLATRLRVLFAGGGRDRPPLPDGRRPRCC